MVNEFSARVRYGDPVALRKFLHAVRRRRTHREAWEALELQPRTYYRLLAFVRSEGHSCD